MKDWFTVDGEGLSFAGSGERRTQTHSQWMSVARCWRTIGIATALCLLSYAASAATFLLHNGERLDGEVIHATRNTLMVRETIGRIRQLSHGEVETVEITTRDGTVVSGALLGWRDGVYDLEAGDRQVSIEDGKIVEEAEATPPQLKISSAEADEGAGGMEFQNVLSQPAGRSIFIVYGTFDRTATAGEDYQDVRGSLEIEPGQSSAVVRILLIDDDVAEDDETFEVFVTADEEVTSIENKRAIGTILNDDN
jgi:hypothetical protein